MKKDTNLKNFIKTTMREFLNEEVEIKQPIVIKSKKNELMYIKIYFDEKGRVDKIENKWDVNLPKWYGFIINEITVNDWIRRKEPDLYIEKNVNENTGKFAFDDEIKFELKRYLQNTIWGKVGGVDERVDKLLELHSKFINNVRNKMSAEEIAKSLFEYEKNILDRK